MAENTNETNTGFSVFRVLVKKLPLIIIIAVLFTVAGLLLALFTVKPIYTATRTVILRTSTSEFESGASTTNDITLAKMLLPNVSEQLTGERVQKYANQRYEKKTEKDDGVLCKNVSTSYGEDTLIFKISYSDYDENLVEAKLVAVIDGFNDFLAVENGNLQIIMAENVRLVNLENRASDPTVSYNYVLYILGGALIGLVIAVVIVLLRSLFDNTVKNKEEFEQATGVPVISVIEKKK